VSGNRSGPEARSSDLETTAHPCGENLWTETPVVLELPLLSRHEVVKLFGTEGASSWW